MKPFPRRIAIDLPDALRSGLETIAEMDRSESPEDLVKVTLSKGIVFTLSDSTDLSDSPRAEEVARNLENLKEHVRSLQQGGNARALEATANANVRPPEPSVLYRLTMEQMRALQQPDLAAANDPDGDESPSKRSPEVERYVGAPISEELRVRLETFLRDHPELDLERGIAILLGQGLDQAERGAKARTATDKMVELGEKLYAKAIAGVQG